MLSQVTAKNFKPPSPGALCVEVYQIQVGRNTRKEMIIMFRQDPSTCMFTKMLEPRLMYLKDAQVQFLLVPSKATSVTTQPTSLFPSPRPNAQD